MIRTFTRAARAAFATGLLVAATMPAAAQSINTSKGVAVGGYDPVAYITAQQAVKGQPAFSATEGDATYYFASQANRDLFLKDPKRYQPQYGGFCAYGVSRGYKVDVDPTAFAIVDGKLYLNYSHRVQRTWNEDRPGYIRKADATWPGLK